jgi:hypothetical protein
MVIKTDRGVFEAATLLTADYKDTCLMGCDAV